jgi:hypothetical protein
MRIRMRQNRASRIKPGAILGWRRSRSPWLTATTLAFCFREHL